MLSIDGAFVQQTALSPVTGDTSAIGAAGRFVDKWHSKKG